MKKIILVSLMLLGSIIFSQPSFAGPFFPGCYALCVAGCEAIFAASGIAAAGVGAIATAAAGLPACLEGCVAACTPFCFSSSTTLIVLENGVGVKKNIALVRDGDLVSTLVDGKLTWTKVIKNTKTEGIFRFVQIDLQNEASSLETQIIVTPNHGLIFIAADRRLTIDSADKVEEGDLLISPDGSTLRVTTVNNINMQDQYTLSTIDGTVLASGVFVSTICSEEFAGGENLWNEKLEAWRARHKQLFENVTVS